MVDNKILIPSIVGGTVFLIIFGLATKEYWNYRKKENRRIEGVNKYEGRKEVERLKKQQKELYTQLEKNKEKKREKEQEKKEEELDIIFGENPEFYPDEYYQEDSMGRGIVKKSKKHKRNGKHKTKRSKH
jgi:hypothetical protein